MVYAKLEIKMRKLFLASALFLLAFGLILASPLKKNLAQSPIRCGLINEPCCNLAGGPPNACQTGLICRSGTCQDNPNDSILPTPRGLAQEIPSCTLSGGGTGLDTAIGCIPIEDPDAFIGFILRWAIGIGGGIAFLLIIYASFTIMSSRGNPERLKAGQELLTSAIAGIIMIIFSIFILRVIGVNILGIFQ